METTAMEFTIIQSTIQSYKIRHSSGVVHQCVIEKCNSVISLEAVNTLSYNVSVAGSLVMYHRQYTQRAVA